jgi:hypothetical protein
MQPASRQAPDSNSSAQAGTEDDTGVHPVASWSPQGTVWSTPAWNDTALAPRRFGITASVGLGLLALLAFIGAVSRGVGPSCTTGSDCNRLGVVAAEGAAQVAQTPERAARLYQRACDLGDAAGCNNLGLAFQSAPGVPERYARAFRAFELACSRGLAEGCSNQAVLYEQGRGAPRNLGDALRLYTQACRHGSSLGCSNLGALYAKGRGVAKDRDTALFLFAEACNAGNAIGCSNLIQIQAREP